MPASYRIENNEIVITIPNAFDMHLSLTDDNIVRAEKIVANVNNPKKRMKERLEDLKMLLLFLFGGRKLVETVRLRQKGDTLIADLEAMIEPRENAVQRLKATGERLDKIAPNDDEPKVRQL